MSLRRIVFTLCVSLSLLSIAIGQNLYDCSNTSKYANYLFESKQYDLAKLEYKRLCIMNSTDTLSKLRLFQTYRMNKDYENAKKDYSLFFINNYYDCPYPISNEYTRILFEAGEYNSAYSFISKNITITDCRKNELITGSLLLQYKWDDAIKTLENNSTNCSKKYHFGELKKMTESGKTIRYKNPYIAATMSAIIPGSGKAYTKNTADGIYAFLFLTSAAVLTYNSAQKNESVINTYMMAIITISFYSANIYGSYISAKKYNLTINQRNNIDLISLLFD